MTGTVLFVDDDINILNSIKRVFMDSDIKIITASNPFEGIDLVKNNNLSVIVSDNLMPGMTGIEFLQKAKEISPESVRIMITANADVRSAIDAINKGEVYRFITKPWDNNEFKEVVLNAVDKYTIVQSLKKADEATILSLAQTIELKDPYTRGHCDRVARYAGMIAEALNLLDEIKKDIKYGGWLHDCGKIGVPEKILNYKGLLDENGFEIIKRHPLWGADVARLAKLSEGVVNILLCHHERYDGMGYPSGIRGKNIPLEARIVSIADIYDALTSDRPYRKGYTTEKALSIIESMKGHELDPELVDIFFQVIRHSTVREQIASKVNINE